MPSRDDKRNDLLDQIRDWTDEQRALLFEVLDEGPTFARRMWRALERPAQIATLTLGGTERAEAAFRSLCEGLEKTYCPCGNDHPDEDHDCPLDDEDEGEEDFDSDFADMEAVGDEDDDTPAADADENRSDG